MLTELKVALIALLIGVLGGIALGYRLYHAQPQPLVEKAAPAIYQTDGSLVLQRTASQSPAQVAPQASVPAGYHEVRQVRLVVRAHTAVVSPAAGADSPQKTSPPDANPQGESKTDCPPVHLNLDLVQSKAGDERVIASSTDGDVLGGLDIPVQQAPIAMPKPLNWRAQLLVGFSAGQRHYGAEVSRDVGPFVASFGYINGTAFVGAGLRF